MGDASFLVASVLIVLVVSLVCSSADTLQNAIVASYSRDISDGDMDLITSRLATVAMIPLAIYMASGPTIYGFEINALSVFGIFLFADMLAAATVSPVLLTLWGGVSLAERFHCLFGFASVALYGLQYPLRLRFLHVHH